MTDSPRSLYDLVTETAYVARPEAERREGLTEERLTAALLYMAEAERAPLTERPSGAGPSYNLPALRQALRALGFGEALYLFCGSKALTVKRYGVARGEAARKRSQEAERARLFHLQAKALYEGVDAEEAAEAERLEAERADDSAYSCPTCGEADPYRCDCPQEAEREETASYLCPLCGDGVIAHPDSDAYAERLPCGECEEAAGEAREAMAEAGSKEEALAISGDFRLTGKQREALLEGWKAALRFGARCPIPELQREGLTLTEAKAYAHELSPDSAPWVDWLGEPDAAGFVSFGSGAVAILGGVTFQRERAEPKAEREAREEGEALALKDEAYLAERVGSLGEGLIFDGSAYSPSWRGLAGGAEAYERASALSEATPNGEESLPAAYLTEAYDSALEAVTERLGLHWEEGCLFRDAEEAGEEGPDLSDPATAAFAKPQPSAAADPRLAPRGKLAALTSAFERARVLADGEAVDAAALLLDEVGLYLEALGVPLTFAEEPPSVQAYAIPCKLWVVAAGPREAEAFVEERLADDIMGWEPVSGFESGGAEEG